MIILASQSPRRKQLMEKYVTSSFVCEPANVDEIKDERLPAEENVKINALKKGIFIFQKYPHALVISADTVVVLNNIIYGKPKDEEDAKRILKELSGKTHKVITAYFIKQGNKEVLKTVISLVTFKRLSDKVIDEYVATKSPLDKAGAYGIQDEYCKNIIKTYAGSLNNIIGFPIEDIKKDLSNFTLKEFY